MLGGIVTSAVLTFFVVPSAFWLFERRSHQEKLLGIEGLQAQIASTEVTEAPV
jgi:hypothetical protein